MFAARNAHKIIVDPILDVVALDYTNCDLRFWTDKFPDGGYTQFDTCAHARGAQGTRGAQGRVEIVQ